MALWLVTLKLITYETVEVEAKTQEDAEDTAVEQAPCCDDIDVVTCELQDDPDPADGHGEDAEDAKP